MLARKTYNRTRIFKICRRVIRVLRTAQYLFCKGIAEIKIQLETKVEKRTKETKRVYNK